MAGTPAAVLNVLVRVENGQATAALAETETQLGATGAEAKAMGAATTKSGGALRKLGTAAKLGGAALAVGFVVEAKKSVEVTQDLAKTTWGLHKNLGFTTKSASGLASVLKARGIDSNKAQIAFKALATQVKAAGDGSATSKQLFDELGISQKQLAKNSHDLGALMPAIAKGLDNVGAGATRTADAQKLFGRGALTLLPILRDGAKAYRDQIDLVNEYGAVLKGKALKNQVDLIASTRESKIAWQGFQVQLASEVTPTLLKVNKQFQHIARIMADDSLTKDQKFSKVAHIIQQDFDKVLQFILDLIPKIASNVGKTAPKVAVAFVQGFLDADIWGKLALGAWVATKFGLTKKVFQKIGTKVAAVLGTEIAAGEGAAAAGTTFGGVLGPAIGVAAAAAAGVWFEKKFHPIKNLLTDTRDTTDLLGGRKKEVMADLKDLRDMTHAEQLKMVKDAKADGSATAQAWIKAYHKLKESTSHDGDDFAHHAAANSKKAADAASKAANQTKAATEQTNAALGKAKNKVDDTTRASKQDFDGLASNVKQNSGKVADSVTTNFNKAQQDAQGATTKIKARTAQHLGETAATAKKRGKDVYKGVGIPVLNLATTVMAGMQNIGDNTNKALDALGVKKAIKFVLGSVKKAAGLKEGGVVKAAKGALVGGSGDQDTVPLHIGGQLAAMVQPGELVSVANRPTTNALMAANDTMKPMARRGGGRVPRLKGGGKAGGSPYRYPLGKGAVFTELDMGVDYAGAGVALGAIGSGRIVNPSDYFASAGYGAGGFAYKMDAGRPAGYSPASDTIYMYESLKRTPAASGHFAAGEIIAHITNAIEMGFAAPNSTGQPLAAYIGEDVSDAGRHGPGGTRSGQAFQKFIGDLASGAGVMAGTMGPGGKPWKNIAREILRGPGAWGDVGQGALDEVWRAANAYGRKQVGGGAAGVPKSLPPSLRKYNQTYPSAVYPSAAWSGLFRMPPSKVAELAEWAGGGQVPGWTMERVSTGEGDLRPGSESTDGGYGMWGYTPSAAGIVLGHPGPDAHNPIIDAQIMAAMYKANPGGAPPSTAIWHGWPGGDPQAHYQGPMLKLGGILKRLATGGVVYGPGGGGGGSGIVQYLHDLASGTGLFESGRLAGLTTAFRRQVDDTTLNLPFLGGVTQLYGKGIDVDVANANVADKMDARLEGKYDGLSPALDDALQMVDVARALGTVKTGKEEFDMLKGVLLGPGGVNVYKLLPAKAKAALDMLDSMGYLNPAMYKNKSELEWLTDELDKMLGMRNAVLQSAISINGDPARGEGGGWLGMLRHWEEVGLQRAGAWGGLARVDAKTLDNIAQELKARVENKQGHVEEQRKWLGKNSIRLKDSVGGKVYDRIKSWGLDADASSHTVSWPDSPDWQKIENHIGDLRPELAKDQTAANAKDVPLEDWWSHVYRLKVFRDELTSAQGRQKLLKAPPGSDLWNKNDNDAIIRNRADRIRWRTRLGYLLGDPSYNQAQGDRSYWGGPADDAGAGNIAGRSALHAVQRKIQDLNQWQPPGGYSTVAPDKPEAMLADLQGLITNYRFYQKLPPWGTLQGQIFDVQDMVEHWFDDHPPKWDTGVFHDVDTGGVSDNSAALLGLSQQMLESAQRQLAVYDAQRPVFAPFAGSFDKGGTVPGPVGSPQMALVHGGETITPPDAGTPGDAGVQVHLHFANGMEWLSEFVSAEVRSHGRTVSSHVRRSVNG